MYNRRDILKSLAISPLIFGKAFGEADLGLALSGSGYKSIAFVDTYVYKPKNHRNF